MKAYDLIQFGAMLSHVWLSVNDSVGSQPEFEEHMEIRFAKRSQFEA